MGIFSAQDPSNGGSLFRTQANTQFNSFQDPIQTMNMGGPGWGVSSNQMTPSYAAPFRPQGQEGPINSPRPGFFHSVHNQLNPMAQNGYGRFADPFWGQQQYRESLYGKPMDAGMWTAQNIGVGAGSMWAANAMTKGWMGKGAALGSDFMRNVGTGMMGGFASGTNTGMAIRGGMGVAGAVGGGLFGGLIAPAMIAQGMVAATDAAIFDPYTNQRNTARNLRENFSGITFGGGEQGASHWGRGLSFSSSNRISSDVTKAGFSNFGMTNKEISGISDMASRAGLLENINPKDFAKQITSITKQVAVIAAVANDPDFRNSIEIMAKLKAGGARIDQMSGIMGRMGGYAGVSGISTKRMAELSQQGEFLAAANNITPYIGGTMYAQSYSSAAAASRNGLISPALLARMGGVEGAAQSSITGRINASQTPYNQAMMANQYMGGMSRTGNVTADLSTFGSMMARDPTKVFGAMGLHGGRMTSKQMESDPNAMHDQIISIARQANMLDKNGKLDSGNAYLIAKMVTGDHRAAERFVHEQNELNDSGNVNNQAAGMKNAFTKDVATMMDAHGTNGPLFVNALKGKAKNIGAGVQEFFQNGTNYIQQSEARGLDKLFGVIDDMKYGVEKTGKTSASSMTDETDWQGRRGLSTGDLLEGGSRLWDRSKWQDNGTLNIHKVGRLLGVASAANNKEALDDYIDVIKKNGITAEQMIATSEDVNSDTGKRTQGMFGTKGADVFKNAYQKLRKVSKAAGYDNADSYMRKMGLTHEDVISKFGSGDIDLNRVVGNANIDASGDQVLQENYRQRRKALDEGISTLREKASKNLISGGAFDSQLNRLAAEKNLVATDEFGLHVKSFGEAVQAMPGAKKSDTPKEAPKPSKAGGTLAPVQPTDGKR